MQMSSVVVRRFGAILFSLSTLMSLSASSARVSDVSAAQRWPWNNLVDIDFVVSDVPAGEIYRVDISARCQSGGPELTAKTLVTEPVVKAGANRVTWDFGKDYPDFVANDLMAVVTLTPDVPASELYMVIDVSAGPSATAYPVRYTTVAPVHTPGANDPCKTTEIWLKRVRAGTYQTGGSKTYGYASHTCILTHDYYLGVFAMTQAQVANVTTAIKPLFTNALYAATRPFDNAHYKEVRDSACAYPDDKTVTDDSLIGRLRARTGLSTLDLPTEWQWEVAARAGIPGKTRCEEVSNYRYGRAMPPGETVVDYSWTADYGTSYVDRYEPNNWGFYGVLGNVNELCANMGWRSAVSEGATLTDPEGPSTAGLSASERAKRFARGGSWSTSWAYLRLDTTTNVVNDNGTNGEIGLRLCVTVR